MSSANITTLITMVESLPDDMQARVVERLREFITDLADEAQWESSFKQTQNSLIAAARQAKREIAEGQATNI